MKQRTVREAPSSSAVYAYLSQIMDLGRQWGLHDQDMLANTGISTDLPHSPETSVSPIQKLQIARNIVQLSGRSDLGFAFGMRCKFIAHGPVGYAAMSSPTLQDAIDIFCQYGWLLQNEMQLSARLDDGFMVITTAGLPECCLGREVMLEAIFSTLYCAICYLLGARHIPEIAIHFTGPEPAYYQAYQSELPQVLWSQALNQVCIPRSLIAEELVTANPLALLQATTMIEQELAARGKGAANVVARVRSILQSSLCDFPTLSEVATCLHISTSTLKRRLKMSGHTYQAILDEVREAEARKLMRNSELDLQGISGLLGFKDPACFTKAFRRWTGVNPSTIRRAG